MITCSSGEYSYYLVASTSATTEEGVFMRRRFFVIVNQLAEKLGLSTTELLGVLRDGHYSTYRQRQRRLPR